MTTYFTHFSSLSSIPEFINMSGHGIYVWGAWGLVIVIMTSLVIHAHQQRQQLLKRLALQHKIQQQKMQKKYAP